MTRWASARASAPSGSRSPSRRGPRARAGWCGSIHGRGRKLASIVPVRRVQVTTAPARCGSRTRRRSAGPDRSRYESGHGSLAVSARRPSASAGERCGCRSGGLRMWCSRRRDPADAVDVGGNLRPPDELVVSGSTCGSESGDRGTDPVRRDACRLGTHRDLGGRRRRRGTVGERRSWVSVVRGEARNARRRAQRKSRLRVLHRTASTSARPRSSRPAEGCGSSIRRRRR